MADSRRLQSIASRYDLEVERHPNRWRAYRNWLALAALPASIILSFYFVVVDGRGLESRPVSTAHRSFEQNCQTCHDRSYAPLHRLLMLDNSVHSVSDDACRQCHAENSLDHIEHDLVTTTLLEGLATGVRDLIENRFTSAGCAGCHQEHRGMTLSAVSDGHCTGCHRESKATLKEATFAIDFERFSDHPEFAVWRDSGTHDRHRSLRLTSLVNGARVDATRIRFNHHRHLDPELPNSEREPVALTCRDCHQPDASGAYFEPIDFAQHCEACHQLGFVETGPLPHETPDIIRGILLDRIANRSPRPLMPGDPIGGLTREDPPPEQAADRWTELQARLESLEQRLFGDAGFGEQRPAAVLESACSKCHFIDRFKVDEGSNWDILPTDIPQRWLPHSTFRHDRHDAIRCEQCHSRGAATLVTADRDAFYAQVSGEVAGSRSIFASRTARDVLLPSIDVCRACHDPERTVLGSAASSGCVTCHNYHHSTTFEPASSIVVDFLTSVEN